MKLIIPQKNQHNYVVGIDFGHGETSAAVCPIEWDKAAGQRETKVLDIDLDKAARKKVITSAICRMPNGILIGDEAFEHMTDNNGIRVCFKQKPTSLDGEAENLMIDYMQAVYARIRESLEELTEDNHIVYIARPSGWVEEDSKELYRQMAIKAGIPLAGLTSESRAAIFYAKSPSVNFSKEISKGAIVFDLGSSTLDFTYLSDNEKPIDYGYNLGASIIDNAILEDKILTDEDVSEFIGKYPEYRDALKFKARQFKENAYGRNEDLKTVGGFPLGNIIDGNESSYDDYADVYVKLRIANLAELNEMIEARTHYMDELRKALKDFKDTKIPGKTINGVFLTGGASRMNFIRPIISEVLGLPIDKVKIDNDNPSLTISRGIALLGVTDAITSILVSELRAELPSLVNNNQMFTKLCNTLSESITNSAWGEVSLACTYWVNNGKTTDVDELKEIVKSRLEDFQKSNTSKVVDDALNSFMKDSMKDIRTKMNDIIKRYAPDREISTIDNIHIGNVQTINDSLAGMSSTIAHICDSISDILSDILWAALGIFLWVWLCAPYYRSDESKRQGKVDDIMGKKRKVISDIKKKIFTELSLNASFKQIVTSSLSNYYKTLIENDLQQVMIPIE